MSLRLMVRVELCGGGNCVDGGIMWKGELCGRGNMGRRELCGWRN